MTMKTSLVTVTQLATSLNVDRAEMIERMTRCRLLTPLRRPTARAVEHGLCRCIDKWLVLWHRQRTAEALAPPEPDDWDQTPEDICRAIIGSLPWTEGELVLEPFRGKGNFYRNLPTYVRRAWCEIKEGRDFFRYDGARPDTIITNPPYRDKARGYNLVVPSLERCLQVARQRVIFFLSYKALNALTPTRLRQVGEWGWGITSLSMWEVKKWKGRYWLVVWERDKPSIIKAFPADRGARNSQ